MRWPTADARGDLARGGPKGGLQAAFTAEVLAEIAALSAGWPHDRPSWRPPVRPCAARPERGTHAPDGPVAVGTPIDCKTNATQIEARDVLSSVCAHRSAF